MDQHLPKHIAIIMDGNGRWAKKRNKPRSFGHLEGLKTAKRIIAYLSQLQVPFVTLYVFSTENWRRPLQEVNYLMGLVLTYIKNEFSFYDTHNLKVTFTGDIHQLPVNVQQALKETAEYTKTNSGTTVNLAINYGGRDEIIRAVNALIADNGSLERPLTIEDISQHLDHPDFPDPDLIVRSAGEKRLSNFLLWQSAYSEFYFNDTLWPDWTKKDVDAALDAYQQRTRKFGGITT